MDIAILNRFKARLLENKLAMRYRSLEPRTRKILWLCILLVFLFLLPVRIGVKANSNVPLIGTAESIATNYCNHTLVKATAAYAAAKVVDATVSVIQNTQISIQPFGFGVTFAPGGMLEAANDAIEYISHALLRVISIVSVEKLTIGLLSWFCFKLFLPLAAILGLIYCLRRGKSAWAKPTAQFLAKFGILAWLFFPCMALVADYVNSSYLDAYCDQKLQSVNEGQASMSKLSSSFEADSSLPTAPQGKEAEQEQKSLLDKAKDMAGNAVDKAKDMLPDAPLTTLKNKATAALNHADDICGQLLDMLYIFILNVLVLPVIALYIFLKFTVILLRQLNSRLKDRESNVADNT